MKKQENVIFAQNLTKSRHALGWSQSKAADMLGITRAAYGAYEEGRALPALRTLPHLSSTFAIIHILAFLENPDFDYFEQEKEYTVTYDSALEKRYAEADPQKRKIVDAALGIGIDCVTY